MNYQDNDTLNANQQNAGQQKESKKTQKDVAKYKEGVVAKMMASLAGGMVIGAAAAYGVERLAEKAETEPVVADDTKTTDVQETPAETTEATEAAETVQTEETTNTDVDGHAETPVQVKTVYEVKEVHHHHYHTEVVEKPVEVKTVTPQEPEPVTPKPVGNFFEEHEITIIEIRPDEIDGHSVQTAFGVVDGHLATFVIDSDDRVIAVTVDVNDNIEIDEGEMLDLRAQNLSGNQLRGYMIMETEPSIEVVSVQTDVDMDGQLVNTAAVIIDGDNAMLVDTTRNGEVDILARDVNHDNELQDDEIKDVSESHIPMPTQDDINANTNMAHNEMPDYVNDADTGLYDI